MPTKQKSIKDYIVPIQLTTAASVIITLVVFSWNASKTFTKMETSILSVAEKQVEQEERIKSLESFKSDRGLFTTTEALALKRDIIDNMDLRFEVSNTEIKNLNLRIDALQNR